VIYEFEFEDVKYLPGVFVDDIDKKELQKQVEAGNVVKRVDVVKKKVSKKAKDDTNT
jgi:hypothetical protein